MTTVKKNVGLIELDPSGRKLQNGEIMEFERHSLKKIYTAGNPGNVKLHYPEAEVVEDTHSIIHDSSIDVVIISSATSEDLGFIGDAIKSGKNLLMM